MKVPTQIELFIVSAQNGEAKACVGGHFLSNTFYKKCLGLFTAKCNANLRTDWIGIPKVFQGQILAYDQSCFVRKYAFVSVFQWKGEHF